MCRAQVPLGFAAQGTPAKDVGRAKRSEKPIPPPSEETRGEVQYAVDHPDEDVLEWRGVEADGQDLQDAQDGREHDGHGGVEDSFGGMKVVAVEPDQQGEGRDERHGEKDAERGEEEGPKDREDGGVNGRGRVRAAVHRLRRVLRLARCAEDTAAARRCV